MGVTRKSAFLCVIVITFFVMACYIAALNDHFLTSATKFSTSFRQFASDALRNAPRSHGKRKISCTEITQIVFIKTHKTASTTTNSIIQRFGYNRSLAFALPKKGHHFDEQQPFSHGKLQYQRPPSNQSAHFNIIASHMTYNRPELDKVIPNATYITIIRSPVQRFESAFSFFEYASKFDLNEGENALKEFMKEPDKYVTKLRGRKSFLLRNGMSVILGFDHRFHDNDSAINEMIDRLDRELDLVLISDYFDESLVLLKNALCWKLDDLLYISKFIRTDIKRYPISKSVAKMILKWNKADVKLYEHFNKTFWKKVHSYGADFYKDVREYRTRLQEFQEDCVEMNTTEPKSGRVYVPLMKANASAECRLALIDNAHFHDMLKQEAKENYNLIKHHTLLMQTKNTSHSSFPHKG
ncbi:galactosylceramide sulfotransferase-like isoform X2 [Ptychodera flava]|uniref:galactosylceramide sulfotransferase-like isoform X2 n=1 Tax=Ptychodera flava TaxID=63121 RepID=UPI00396A1707